MTEDDYIKATNLAKIRIVVTTLKDIMEGEEYGVSESKYKTALVRLISIEDTLTKVVLIDHDNGVLINDKDK